MLYDRDCRVKLCDFAFSRFKEKCGNETSAKMDSRVGTPAWMAPEVLRGDQYSRSADIYSYGIILWEVVSRKEPFKGLNPYAIAYKVGSEGLQLEIPEECPAVWRTLMQLCWGLPAKRPTVLQIVEILRELKDDVAQGKAIVNHESQHPLMSTAVDQ